MGQYRHTALTSALGNELQGLLVFFPRVNWPITQARLLPPIYQVLATYFCLNDLLSVQLPHFWMRLFPPTRVWSLYQPVTFPARCISYTITQSSTLTNDSGGELEMDFISCCKSQWWLTNSKHSGIKEPLGSLTLEGQTEITTTISTPQVLEIWVNYKSSTG